MSSCVFSNTLSLKIPTFSLSAIVPIGLVSVPTLSTRCLKGSATLRSPLLSSTKRQQGLEELAPTLLAANSEHSSNNRSPKEASGLSGQSGK